MDGENEAQPKQTGGEFYPTVLEDAERGAHADPSACNTTSLTHANTPHGCRKLSKLSNGSFRYAPRLCFPS
eukprot:2289344-Pyramimonas_sp.AAC.1